MVFNKEEKMRYISEYLFYYVTRSMFVFFYSQKARPAASPSPYAFEFRGKLVKNELVGLYMSSVKKGRDKNSFRECALNSSYLLEHLNATKKMGYFSKFTTGQKTCWLCVNCGTKSHVTTSLFLFEISPNLRTIKAVSQPSSLSLSLSLPLLLRVVFMKTCSLMARVRQEGPVYWPVPPPSLLLLLGSCHVSLDMEGPNPYRYVMNAAAKSSSDLDRCV